MWLFSSPKWTRAIQYLTRATWSAANEISWLGFRDLGQETLLATPTFTIPQGLLHIVRDNSQDPRSRSRGVSVGMGGGVGTGRQSPNRPAGGASPGSRERSSGKGLPGSTPCLATLPEFVAAQTYKGEPH